MLTDGFGCQVSGFGCQAQRCEILIPLMKLQGMTNDD
jgi:hypothetical protein